LVLGVSKSNKRIKTCSLKVLLMFYFYFLKEIKMILCGASQKL
jgi:hypothetical protein